MQEWPLSRTGIRRPAPPDSFRPLGAPARVSYRRSVNDVCIIGGGLAGLACAIELQRSDVSFCLVEAEDTPGGRVRTDILEGYRLDRGFQILLLAYPETRRLLDYRALDLRTFEPGALVHVEGAMHRVADPLRRPLQLGATLKAPIGSLADKIRLGLLSLRLRAGPARDLLYGPDGTTLEALREAGFSQRIIDRFFAPFLGGIQLDPKLEVSRRRFAIIFRMLAIGDTGLPARGMGEIPAQLAARLPPGTVRYSARVAALEGNSVHLEDGTSIEARNIVVATDGPAASRLLGLEPVPSRQATCLYFSAPRPPFDGPLLALEGEEGPVRNLIVPTNLSAEYAPTGQALISAAVLDSFSPGLAGTQESPDRLVEASCQQLRGWFGEEVAQWTHLRSYRIAHGHPDQRAPFEAKQKVRLGEGRYVCGDHRDTASIQGALFSGWRTARSVLRDLRALPARADTET